MKLCQKLKKDIDAVTNPPCADLHVQYLYFIAAYYTELSQRCLHLKHSPAKADWSTKDNCLIGLEWRTCCKINDILTVYSSLAAQTYIMV